MTRRSRASPTGENDAPNAGDQGSSRIPLFQRDPEVRQFLPKLGPHLLLGRLADIDPQALLEAVAPPARVARVEMELGRDPLLLREDVVEVRLHHLLAVRTRIDHVPASSKAVSASCPLRIRLPRWSLDITVPTGMSRISAASA